MWKQRTEIQNWGKKEKKNKKRDRNGEGWKRDTGSSITEGYTAMMSPHAGTVRLRYRLAI